MQKEFEKPPEKKNANTIEYTGITNLSGERMDVSSKDVKGPLVGRGIFVDGKEAGPGTPGWRDTTPEEKALPGLFKEGKVNVYNREGGKVYKDDKVITKEGKVTKDTPGEKIKETPKAPKETKAKTKEKNSTDPTFETFQWGDATSAPTEQ